MLSAGETTVFSTPLSEGVAALREAGWNVPAEGVETVDGVLQLTATGGVRKFITYDFPVERGKSYAGSVMVKALDVSLPQGGRGATLFFGLLGEDKSWINGGQFPSGPTGSSGWTKVSTGLTRAIAPHVKYIQIWIALEGQGTAQFKNLEVHTVETEWSIGEAQNPPSFTSQPVKLKNGTPVPPWLRISLSKNPDFPEGETFNEMVTGTGTYPFPYALEPGKWYAKAQWCIDRLYPMMETLTFTLGDYAENPPLKVTPKIPSGEYNERPEFAFTFYPVLPQTYSATIGDMELAVKSVNGATIVFTPVQPLPKGTYDIRLVANAQSHRFLYINKSPAHRFTFRDDHMLCIDGEPFFPIGTYRDPSDDMTVFDGIEEAQFNVTHSYSFENLVVSDETITRYLDDCQNHNLLAFMGIPRRHLYHGNTYELQRHCAVMVDHPTLLSIYLADEPECWLNRYSMKNGADAAKAACPNVPRIILLCTADANNDDVLFMGDGLSDILWHDPYPIQRGVITDVKRNMETMRGVCHDRQPVWCVVQAFDWDQYAVKNKKPEDVEPKAGKIRCMTHLALAANVQGIIYYWLPKDRYDMRIHSPIQWAETVACSRELNGLYKYLVGRNSPQKIALPDGVDYWCRQAEDGSYAVGIVNTTDHEMSFDVNVLNFNRKVTLGPWGVEVIK